MSTDHTSTIRTYLQTLQDSIVESIKKVDSTIQLQEDVWQREEGGGGRTRALAEGSVIEKGGVNFSEVYGEQLPPSATANRPELAGASFQALGVSVVMHPRNPYCPTSHANVRYFCATPPNKEPVWWFGGGFDLTPYYPFEEDAVYWHEQAQKACQSFSPDYYPEFKKWCDEYFYLKHRQETRGVGGLFYDDFNRQDWQHSFDFTRSVGDHYHHAYFNILQKRLNTPYGEREKSFQKMRRGRYVEFNLLYDRGTLFGLQSGGRTESILMSLPPQVEWQYDYQPPPDSPEALLYQRYLKPQNWL